MEAGAAGRTRCCSAVPLPLSSGSRNPPVSPSAPVEVEDRSPFGVDDEVGAELLASFRTESGQPDAFLAE